MTEPTTEPTPDLEPTEDTEASDTDTDDTTSTDGEAARFRRRLRDLKAEHEQLTATLDTYRKRDVQTLAESAGLADGSDLFSTHELADLLADDGTVDAEKVTAAAAELIESKPHWSKPKPDFGAGDRGPDINAGHQITWGDVLRG